MKKFFSSSKTKYFSFLLVILALALLCCACSSDEARISEISSAAIKNDRRTVKVEITLSDEDVEKYKDDRLYLLSLESGSLIDGVHIVGDGKTRGKMTFKIRLDRQSASFLSSPLVLAKKSLEDKSMIPSYTLVTELEYINNPWMLATKNFVATDSGEIKGLESRDLLDASAIGAQRVLVEVDINSIMCPEYAEGAINYIYDDKSYYFEGDKVAELDRQIKTANALGMKVYLRTVILPPDGKSEEITELYATTPSKKTEGCVINAGNPIAMGYLRAFYTFLAERYNEKGALAVDIIVGEKVNDYKTNCAAASDTAFTSNYFAWARVANNIFQSHNRNSKIYVSVDGNMRVDGTDALGTKVFLLQLAEDAKLSGDYNYAIALSLGNGEDLGDILSGKNSDLALINANSLTSFTDLVSSEEMLYNGKSRVAIIDSLALPTTISEQNRAAYYSYTYYKAREAGFDALIYAANEENSNIFNAEGKQRDFFYTLLICGTQHYNQLYTYLGKIQGAEIPKLADHVTSLLYTEEEIPYEISGAAQRNRRELSLSLSDMIAAGSAYDARLYPDFNADGHEKTHLSMTSAIEDDTAALLLCNILGKEIIESGYIGISMYCPTASDVELVLNRVGGEGEIIYIGKAEVGSVEKTYFFNVSPFVKSIEESDKLTLSVRIPSYAEEKESSLILSDVGLYGSSGSGRSMIFTVVTVAVSTLAICGLLFLLTRRRARSMSKNDD